MKGQFFIIATVIMIYSLILAIQYVYDFADIPLTQPEEMGELYYIQHIKDSLIGTVNNSYNNGGCDRLDADVDATEKFLIDEMIKKGITLTIDSSIVGCPPTASFTFNLRTSELYTETSFTYSP